MHALLRPLTALALIPLLVTASSAGTVDRPDAASAMLSTAKDRTAGPDSLAPAPVRYLLGDTPEQAEAMRIRLHQATSDAMRTRQRPSIGMARSYGPCTLHPGVVYLRKEYQYEAVGMKPYTSCSQAVSAPALIEHRTELRYHWYSWWLQAGETVISTGRNERTYRSKTIRYECVGSEMTTWSGTTLGRVVWQGHTYYARVYQAARELKCGARWP